MCINIIICTWVLNSGVCIQNFYHIDTFWSLALPCWEAKIFQNSEQAHTIGSSSCISQTARELILIWRGKEALLLNFPWQKILLNKHFLGISLNVTRSFLVSLLVYFPFLCLMPILFALSIASSSLENFSTLLPPCPRHRSGEIALIHHLIQTLYANTSLYSQHCLHVLTKEETWHVALFPSIQLRKGRRVLNSYLT